MYLKNAINQSIYSYCERFHTQLVWVFLLVIITLSFVRNKNSVANKGVRTEPSHIFYFHGILITLMHKKAVYKYNVNCKVLGTKLTSFKDTKLCLKYFVPFFCFIPWHFILFRFVINLHLISSCQVYKI